MAKGTRLTPTNITNEDDTSDKDSKTTATQDSTTKEK